jgi:hypothetical protein
MIKSTFPYVTFKALYDEVGATGEGFMQVLVRESWTFQME